MGFELPRVRTDQRGVDLLDAIDVVSIPHILHHAEEDFGQRLGIVAGAANGFLMSGSRVAYQLGEQKSMPASPALSKLNAHSVPSNSVILVGVLACLYSISEQFDMLTNLAVFSCWIFYTLTFVCVIRLRHTHPELERKYKVPGYPVVPILAIISGVYVIISQLALSGLGNTLLSIGSIVVTLIGLPVYSAAKKRYSK